MTLKMNNLLAAAVAGALCLGLAQSAKANSVLFSVSGSNSDGPLAATVNFTAVAGGIDITITNTQTGTLGKGQAVSFLSFGVSGISSPTAFTRLTGESFNPVSDGAWTAADGTAFNDTSAAPPINSIDHWGFNVTGSSVLLATAASPVPGAGNPQYMILPASGTAGSGNSLSNSNFFPFIIGPGDFFLTVPGITSGTVFTASTFNAVIVGFGTGVDTFVTSPGGTPRTPVPVPAAVWTGMALLAGMGIVRKFRKSNRA